MLKNKWCFIHVNRLHVVAAVVCIIFLSSVFLIPFANADWIMFRSDPSHSGAGTGNPALTPTLLWKDTLGAFVYSSLAVVDGVVYLGSGDGNVYALNAATGDKLWNYTTGSYVETSPAVVDGVVYIGSYNGNVYALNAANGAQNLELQHQRTCLFVSCCCRRRSLHRLLQR